MKRKIKLLAGMLVLLVFFWVLISKQDNTTELIGTQHVAVKSEVEVNNLASIVQPNVINNTAVTNNVGGVNLHAFENSAIKVITDLKTGDYALLEPDGRKLSLRDKNGGIIWDNDIVAKIGPYVPLVFEKRMDLMKIDRMNMLGTNLLIWAANGWYMIELQSGKVVGMGE